MHARAMQVLTAAVLVFAASTLQPAATFAADPSPSGPRQVAFEAGVHTGYRFGPDGSITATKSATLQRPSGAHTTRRAYMPGRGNFLYIVDGIWAGYHVRESMVAYVRGEVAAAGYSPARQVSFPAGTVVGYRFDGSWTMTSARIGSLGRPSGAHADRFAIINGQRYYRIVDGGWAGTWVPMGGSFATSALDCRTGQRADATRRVVRTVAGAGPEVALTFDMGGRLDPALDIMRFLLLNRVCTTVFPTGQASQTSTGAAVLAMVRAYPQLFEVGNHTMYHCNLVSGGEGPYCPVGRPSASRMQKELTDAAAIIRAGTGQSPVPYWRPPYGAYDSSVLDAAAGVGYATTAMWGIDTIDWKPPADGGPTAPTIITRIVDRAQDGSVVLMHLGGWNTRNALPGAIHGLRSTRTLHPTSLSDLLDLR